MRAFPVLRLACVAGLLLLASVPTLRAQPQVAPAAPPAPPVAPVAPVDSALQSEMLRLLDALPAQSSMHALHVPSGRTVAVRADQLMSTMSVIKIPIMVQAYRDAEAGRLRLDERHTIREEDLRGGSGLLQRFAVGLAPTMRDLIDQMIITSDNTATDMILARVGKDRVNASLQALGFRDTRVIHTIGDFFRLLQAAYDPQRASWSDVQVFRARPPADISVATMTETRYRFTADAAMWLGSTTAREMNAMLRGIMTASYANREHSDAMLRHLRGQFYNSRLPATLRYASGVTVSHKTGDFPPISGSDVGIIDYPGGPIVISVFTNSNRGDFAVLEATIGRIAARLVEVWK